MEKKNNRNNNFLLPNQALIEALNIGQPVLRALSAQQSLANSSHLSIAHFATLMKSIASNNDFDKIGQLMNNSYLYNFQSLKDGFSLYSDIACSSLLDRIVNLPSNYRIIEHNDEVSGENQYYIKDELTDDNIKVKDVASTFAIIEIIDTISEKEMLEFYNYLSMYPMMGLEHKIGKKILSTLREFGDYDDLNIDLFRARIRRNMNDRPYTVNEMFSPPYGISTQGRFNTHGINVLYLCNTLLGAVKEVRAKKEQTVDIIEVNLNKRIKILDLTQGHCALFNYCKFKSNSEYSLKPEYLIPNFLSQCCKLCGIEGIKYSSDIDNESTNYVFFNISEYDLKHKVSHTKYID